MANGTKRVSRPPRRKHSDKSHANSSACSPRRGDDVRPGFGDTGSSGSGRECSEVGFIPSPREKKDGTVISDRRAAEWLRFPDPVFLHGVGTRSLGRQSDRLYFSLCGAILKPALPLTAYGDRLWLTSAVPTSSP